MIRIDVSQSALRFKTFKEAVTSSKGSGEANELELNGRRTGSNHVVSGTFRITAKVND